MVEIVSIGEALIDFVSLEMGPGLEKTEAFKKAFGGAPANLAVDLARLGASVGFVGKVGDDEFGHFLSNTMKDEGVAIDGLVLDPSVRTTLAFVSLTAKGEREFMFYRHPGADMLLRLEEVKMETIEEAKVVHFGSLSLTHEPSRGALFNTITSCSQLEKIISFDPNLRLSLWSSQEEARVQITKALGFAQIVKFSEEELFFLTGSESIEVACERLFQDPVKIIFVSLGEQGCFFFSGENKGFIEGFKVEVVDTTGAGDGFTAAILANLLPLIKEGIDISKISREELESIGRFANAVGAMIVGSRGAVSGSPYWEDVMSFLEKH